MPCLLHSLFALLAKENFCGIHQSRNCNSVLLDESHIVEVRHCFGTLDTMPESIDKPIERCKAKGTQEFCYLENKQALNRLLKQEIRSK